MKLFVLWMFIAHPWGFAGIPMTMGWYSLRAEPLKECVAHAKMIMEDTRQLAFCQPGDASDPIPMTVFRREE